MNEFAIVIPSKYAMNLVGCMQAICDFEVNVVESEKIIVVDDGARAELERDGFGVPLWFERLQWISGAEPFSFPRNVNLGVAAAGTRDVLLLNDDCMLRTPAGFYRMQEAAYSDPDIMMCAAIVSFSGNRTQQATPAQATAAMNHANDEIIPQEMVCFICVYFKRECFDRFGLFDEAFDGYGWDDDIYCARVRTGGGKIVVYRGTYLDHTHLQSSYRVRERDTLGPRSRQNRVKYDALMKQHPEYLEWLSRRKNH